MSDLCTLIMKYDFSYPYKYQKSQKSLLTSYNYKVVKICNRLCFVGSVFQNPLQTLTMKLLIRNPPSQKSDYRRQS